MFARRILIAVDGSDHSLRALEHAQTLVHGHVLSVALIHVISGEAVGPVSLDEQVEPEDPEVRGERILSDACHILGIDDSDVKQIKVRGNPVEEIVRAAEAFQADLVILGSRGHSGWKGSPVGSVSQAVVRDGTCSVLVVKEKVQHRYGAG